MATRAEENAATANAARATGAILEANRPAKLN